jgi:glycosyltransferase involved in cell wall biosynthesis
MQEIAENVSRRARVMLMVNSMAGGGAERTVLELLRGLDRERVRPALLLLNRRGKLLTEVPPDVPIMDLSAWSERWKAVRRALGLARRVNEWQPDVVISHLTKSNCNLMRAAPLIRPETRLLLTEQNNIARRMRWRSWTYKVWRSLQVRYLYRFAAHIVTVSDGVKKGLAEGYGIPEEQITTIYNPVDVQHVQAQARQEAALPWPGGQDKKLLVAAGRLVPEKGYPDLLRAFARIRSETSCWLVILGKGQKRAELEALTRRLGIEDDVWMPGFVDNPWRYMRCADVYVSASLSEGFHLTIVEAMACRTPVVATDCDFGPGEIIMHGTNGLLTPVGQPAALAERVRSVLDDEAMQQRFAEEGVKRAADFDYEHIARQYEALVRSSMAR